MGNITAEVDKEIWDEIFADEDYKKFAFSILMKMLAKFDNFYSGMTTFLSIVNSTINSLEENSDGQRRGDIWIKQPDVWIFEFMPISHLGIPI